MKCPKCGYLGFEHVDRCRNCGYDFSFISPPDPLELPLKRAAEDLDPPDDRSLLNAPVVEVPEPVLPPPNAPELQRVLAAGPAAGKFVELPLFGGPAPDDLPLITKPSPPRPPLAVRRATPELPRLRPVPPRAPTLDLGLESASPERGGVGRSSNRDTEMALEDAGGAKDAGIGARFVAVVVDVLILVAIDAAVVYLTMQICGIGIGELALLPRVPLLVFLLLQNGGYLVAFTAGGQTIGKMATRIKVVSAEPQSPLDLGCVFIRELVWLVLALPAGLGLLTVLSRDRRGIHDRFAGTRVVRAAPS